jgi:hypothetical protein
MLELQPALIALVPLLEIVPLAVGSPTAGRRRLSLCVSNRGENTESAKRSPEVARSARKKAKQEVLA